MRDPKAVSLKFLNEGLTDPGSLASECFSRNIDITAVQLSLMQNPDIVVEVCIAREVFDDGPLASYRKIGHTERDNQPKRKGITRVTQSCIINTERSVYASNGYVEVSVDLKSCDQEEY